MQKCLDDEILIYLTDNEDKSVVAERFIRILKAKIYLKNDSKDSKSCLGYLHY